MIKTIKNNEFKIVGFTSFLHKYTKTRSPTSLHLFTKHLLIILQFTRIQYFLLTLFIIDTFDLRLGPFQAVKALVLDCKTKAFRP